MDAKTIAQKTEYANKVINEYSNNNTFDPVAILSGTEDRSTKLFFAAVEFINDITWALEKFERAKKAAL